MAPLYDYKGFSRDGGDKKGFIEAENAKAARAKLRSKGLVVTKIVEKRTGGGSKGGKGSSGGSFFGGKVSARDTSQMVRQLASLVKANIPLVEALTAMVDQVQNPKMKEVLSDIKDQVNEGKALAKAMKTHPKVFDGIFVNMVDSGESSGTLADVLLKVADLKEAQLRLRSKVVSGMTYPALMLFVGLVLVGVIFGFVIPELTKVFDSMKKELPPSTVILIALSNIVVNYWYLLIGGMGFSIFSFLKWSASKTGKPKWDQIKLKLPIFGTLFQMVAVTRFSNTMSTLLATGVPILVAMKITKNLMGNLVFEAAIEDAAENITEGQSIAEPLKRSGQFPPLMIHMITIGEKTGELPAMLENVASTYEEQVNDQVERMTALLEPAMIIIMGVFVGIVVMSIFVPLLEISNIGGK